MESSVAAEAFDRGNTFCIDRCDRCDAGAHRFPVNEDRARAALPLAASVFCASQIEIVAKDVEQAALCVRLDASFDSVNADFELF